MNHLISDPSIESQGLRVFRQLTFGLTALVLVGSAFHFWPWPQSSLWKIFCPANCALLIWIFIALIDRFIIAGNPRAAVSLSHISVAALITIHWLSLAYSPDLNRSIIFNLKLMVIYFAGYSLFRTALITGKHQRIYLFSILAVLVCLSAGLWTQWFSPSLAFGFFDSPYKVATYLAILLPLTVVYLIFDRRRSARLLAVGMTVVAGLTTVSLGMLLAVTGAFLAVVLVGGKRAQKVMGILVIYLAMALIGSSTLFPQPNPLRSDITLLEADGQNIKQRYLEWQALINLLEDRTIVGSGAGCVNEYRSEYYHRLPKLNTLKSFDQNGYLATAAEGGLLALVCFLWMLWHYFGLSLDQFHRDKKVPDLSRLRYPLAQLAGLTGAAVGHLFCSVQYNGVLIALVVVLALIDQSSISGKELKS